MARITVHPILKPQVARNAVSFMFDGSIASGIEGEPVSSALIALGVVRFSTHRKDGSPQGLFCANGQCSQCTMLINGLPEKACLVRLEAGMDVRTLEGLPALPRLDEALHQSERRSLRTDILVIGAGPSGLSAACELGRMGFQVIVADDKPKPGGKLVLQTHKFFGSREDCHAGVRGIEIAGILEARLRRYPNVTILSDAPVVAVYKDRKAGIFKDGSSYLLVDFTALLVAAGAREKALLFPGSDLPGVFGAGAFQTLVNRDMVLPARRILIIGSGNVGLIAAYHALQAGMEVVGIVEIAGRVSGYRVHADKLRRLGVPIFLTTTVLLAEGDGRVSRAVTARVDDAGKPIEGTSMAHDVDLVLVATGLVPCDEFLLQARRYGIMAVAAGDAEEIAEASSAMFGGRIAAHRLAGMLGAKTSLDPGWISTRDVLKSRPGDSYSRSPVVASGEWKPVFFCSEEIPCNPCAAVCSRGLIALKVQCGTIMDIPYYKGSGCVGCLACIGICPGLAVTLVRKAGENAAEVIVPWEFNVDFEIGSVMDLVGQEGTFMESSPVIAIRRSEKYSMWFLTFRTSCEKAPLVAGARSRCAVAAAGLPVADSIADDSDAILCRCERVTLGEVVRFIRENDIRDVNQLKSLRVGMGACGGKTCAQLLARAFRLAGVPPESIEPGSRRPLELEVPMGQIVNEGLSRLGGRNAGSRGAP